MQISARCARTKICGLVMGLSFIALSGYNYGITQGSTPAARDATKKLSRRPLHEVETAPVKVGENSTARQTDSEAGVDNVIGHGLVRNATQPRSAAHGGAGDTVETTGLTSYCQAYLKFGGGSEVRYAAWVPLTRNACFALKRMNARAGLQLNNVISAPLSHHTVSNDFEVLLWSPTINGSLALLRREYLLPRCPVLLFRPSFSPQGGP